MQASHNQAFAPAGAGFLRTAFHTSVSRHDNSAQTTRPSAAVPAHWITTAARLSIYRRKWLCVDPRAGQRGYF